MMEGSNGPASGGAGRGHRDRRAHGGDMTTTERPVTQLRAPDRLFIGGDWVPAATSERFDVVDPSTEAVIAQVAAAGNDDIAHAVAAARAAFDHGPWPWLTPAERAAHLHAL